VVVLLVEELAWEKALIWMRFYLLQKQWK
jgi:hypothetical protein